MKVLAYTLLPGTTYSQARKGMLLNSGHHRWSQVVRGAREWRPGQACWRQRWRAGVAQPPRWSSWSWFVHFLAVEALPQSGHDSLYVKTRGFQHPNTTLWSQSRSMKPIGKTWCLDAANSPSLTWIIFHSNKAPLTRVLLIWKLSFLWCTILELTHFHLSHRSLWCPRAI